MTSEATALIRRLTDMHGPVMLQPVGRLLRRKRPDVLPGWGFLTGEADIHVGNLVADDLEQSVPVWMSKAQYEHWQHTDITIDVMPGRGAGFSREAPEGVRFLIRSRLPIEE